jgi:hypothetical protein
MHIRYRRMVRTLRLVSLLILCSTLHAWNAAGHRTIAYIAYRNLNDRTRQRIDLLLLSHPDYSRWIEDIPENERPLAAFLHASVWADEIKGDSRYQNEPRGAAPSEQTTYPDTFRHQNWHYIDQPLAGPLKR